jgi:hypothetical protein
MEDGLQRVKTSGKPCQGRRAQSLLDIGGCVTSTPIHLRW